MALCYVTRGDPSRPPVLLLHGFMGSSADWDAVARALAEERYVIAADLPGHGASVGLPAAAYAMEGAAARLAAVIDAEAAGRADVVGYSMGGRTALYLALAYPEHVRRLVLESASPGLPTAAERARRRQVDAARAERIRTDFRAFLEEWHRQPLFASLARREDLVARRIADRLRNDPEELARALEGLGTGRQPSLWERLSDLRPPARALAGALDAKYARLARQMAARAAPMEAHVVEGAGHVLHVEAAGPYVHYLKDFLKPE